jgi:hypothetical protein
MVNRNHHFPPEDQPCVFCGGSGIQHRGGEFFVCMAPHTENDRERLAKECEEANDSMKRLNDRVKR